MKVNKANKLVENLLLLAKRQVLVGVPEETDPRKDGKGIGNAALAYVHDQGSPAQNIPPRPFMIPGIMKAQDQINIELLAVAKAQLEENKEQVELHLKRAGLIAQSSIRNVINEGEGFTPLKRATLLARLRRRKAARKWSKDKREETMASFHPLVDTGQLRNSVVYQIVEKK